MRTADPIQLQEAPVDISAHTQLPAAPNAPALARAFVAAEVAQPAVTLAAALEDIVLVVSELVTNAVQAGSTSIGLALRGDATKLELVVEDDADGFPTPREASPDATNGRGLAIVAQLADAWETAPREDAQGKRVIATWLIKQ